MDAYMPICLMFKGKGKGTTLRKGRANLDAKTQQK